jgi:hypothetical protein|tara:strand:+ start:902 stop:1384 length:483 start_codon:yes stop_codon:yes gene_type:complete
LSYIFINFEKYINKLNYINHILLILLLTLNIGCSTNEKESNKGLKTSLPSVDKKPSVNSQKGKDYDACDCNRRSRKILDKTLSFRLQFNSMEDLKKNQESKSTIRKFAREYVNLTRKCFEINNARLLVDSECNNLRLLQEKKDSLRNLGIQIEQGESVRL